MSRRHFDALCGPGGAFLVGDPDTVAAKVRDVSDALGGVARVSFQMSAASGDHAAMLRAIGLLGTEVGARLREGALVAA